MDKTNAADLASRVFTILISVTWLKKNMKFIAIPQISSKTGLANSDITNEALNCTASL